MKKHTALCLLLGCTIMTPQLAHATKTVSSPYIKKGDLEAKWKGGFSHDDDDDGQDGAWEMKPGISYGVTDRFFVELEGKLEKDGDSSQTDFSAVELEGRYGLTTEENYWLSSALKGVYKYNTSGSADKIEAALLLGKKMGDFGHRANFAFERAVGEDSNDDTEFAFSWSSRYSVSPAFQPGFEYYADFGDISDTGSFSEQGHQLGPVIYGKLGEHVGYEVGYLAGLSDSAPDGEAKLILGYKIDY